MVAALREVETILGSLREGAWSYEWLPRAAVAALLHLIAASILQPVAKLQRAAVHLTQGRACVDAQLRCFGTDLQVPHPSWSRTCLGVLCCHPGSMRLC